MFPANGDGSHPHVPAFLSARPPRRTHYPHLGLFAQSETETTEVEVDEDLNDDWDESITESWPAWTDAPAELLDYDAFDDDGNCTDFEIQEEEAY
jgi:hypothetical protein